jgi:hypothetical protein
MADPQTPRTPPPADRPPEETPRRKHRKRGYRGYPNTPAGGDVHTGSGFGGAGSVSRSKTPGDSGVISERTKEDVRKDED